MNDYQERRSARIERLRERAEKKAEQAEASFEATRKLADSIPLGQPILLGHHSEAHSRRDCERIQRGMERGCEAQKEAAELERRAEAAERNTSISSDDPDAIDALRVKLAKLERLRADMVCINRQYRCGGVDSVAGISDEQRDKIRFAMADTSCGRRRAPFESYQLTNLGAKIRTTAKRIAEMEAKSADVTTVKTHGDVILRDDVEANRIQLVFPGKPDQAIIDALKQYGFKWSPSNGAWQRMRGHGARACALAVLAMIKGEIPC